MSNASMFFIQASALAQTYKTAAGEETAAEMRAMFPELKEYKTARELHTFLRSLMTGDSMGPERARIIAGEPKPKPKRRRRKKEEGK